MPPKEDKKKPLPSDLTPAEYLRLHQIDCVKVYRMWSPGESDFGPYETILFTRTGDVPWTAVIVRDQIICREGWEHFYVECY